MAAIVNAFAALYILLLCMKIPQISPSREVWGIFLHNLRRANCAYAKPDKLVA